ncbi:PIR protein [Plasmodium vivax]|uniref:VIR protein n=1 Tax=Plasmodium vivax TaxID=5855 RepID=A0A565A699_PLAVI|nr:PIR protein [Plasmodium vivax]
MDGLFGRPNRLSNLYYRYSDAPCMNDYATIKSEIIQKIDKFEKTTHAHYYQQWDELNKYIIKKDNGLSECYKNKYVKVKLIDVEEIKNFRKRCNPNGECNNQPPHVKKSAALNPATRGLCKEGTDCKNQAAPTIAAKSKSQQGFTAENSNAEFSGGQNPKDQRQNPAEVKESRNVDEIPQERLGITDSVSSAVGKDQSPEQILKSKTVTTPLVDTHSSSESSIPQENTVGTTQSNIQDSHVLQTTPSTDKVVPDGVVRTQSMDRHEIVTESHRGTSPGNGELSTLGPNSKPSAVETGEESTSRKAPGLTPPTRSIGADSVVPNERANSGEQAPNEACNGETPCNVLGKEISDATGKVHDSASESYRAATRESDSNQKTCLVSNVIKGTSSMLCSSEIQEDSESKNGHDLQNIAGNQEIKCLGETDHGQEELCQKHQLITKDKLNSEQGIKEQLNELSKVVLWDHLYKERNLLNISITSTKIHQTLNIITGLHDGDHLIEANTLTEKDRSSPSPDAEERAPVESVSGIWSFIDYNNIKPYIKYIINAVIALAILLLLILLIKYTPLRTIFTKKKRKKQNDMNEKLQRVLQQPSTESEQRRIPFSYSAFEYSP